MAPKQKKVIEHKAKNPRKAARAVAFPDASVYAQVSQALTDSGIHEIKAKVDFHQNLLYGNGNGGMVVDMEHVKSTMDTAVKTLNTSVAKLDTSVQKLVSWKQGMTIRTGMTVTLAFLLGSTLTFVFRYHGEIAQFLEKIK